MQPSRDFEMRLGVWCALLLAAVLTCSTALAAAAAAAAEEEKDASRKAEQQPAVVPSTRNAAEEAICRPFLTSHKTSPLLNHVARDFRVDEDGEFSCELVLQDVNLPAQIRVTIHEGLSLLMMRHVALGKPRHKTAVRHLRLLAQIIPGKFSFSLNAGVWGLARPISQPDLAVQNFYNCIYGKAAKDKTATRANKAVARRYYARVLAYLGRAEEAMHEYGLLQKRSLAGSPADFLAAFHWRQTGSIEEFLVD